MRAAIRIGSLVVLAGVASSCGGGSSMMNSGNPNPSCIPETQPKFAYVLNYSDATISMYTVNSCTGALTETTPATVPTGVNNGFNAESMAIDPMGTFLYVANLGSNATAAGTISMFTINPTTGVLTATSPAMVAAGFFPQGITINSSGKFVYTANSDDNTVSMYTVDRRNGVLAATSPANTFVPPIFHFNIIAIESGFCGHRSRREIPLRHEPG
jgi:DNA-binding beta-propeller fold protein YncE